MYSGRFIIVILFTLYLNVKGDFDALKIKYHAALNADNGRFCSGALVKMDENKTSTRFAVITVYQCLENAVQVYVILGVQDIYNATLFLSPERDSSLITFVTDKFLCFPSSNLCRIDLPAKYLSQNLDFLYLLDQLDGFVCKYVFSGWQKRNGRLTGKLKADAIETNGNSDEILNCLANNDFIENGSPGVINNGIEQSKKYLLYLIETGNQSANNNRLVQVKKLPLIID